MNEDKRDKYIQQSLPENQKEDIEREIQSNKEEKESIAIELGVRAAIEEESQRELRKKVLGFEKERASQKSSFNWTYTSIAASLLLVGTFALYFTQNQGSLFDEYYEVYLNYEVTTLRNEADPNLLQATYGAYDRADYAEAISGFDELIQRDHNNLAHYFFRGISKIEVEQFSEALADLQKVMDLQQKSGHIVKRILNN